MGVIVFNNKNSADYGIVVESPPDFEYPTHMYNTYNIPGRNGVLTEDLKSFKNVPRTYKVAVASDEFQNGSNAIMEFLGGSSGYCRLEDSYDPGVFRMAKYDSQGTIANILGHAARVTVKFDCKPQRYLKIGEEKIQVTMPGTAKGTVFNPTQYNALPLIVMDIRNHNHSSALKFTVNGGPEIPLSNIPEGVTEVTIDCEMCDVFSGNDNLNGCISLTEFPVFEPGENLIELKVGTAYISVIPRWWTI